MTIFSQSVDKRSREAMINFLWRHFRYNTMNSWNNSTSYAHNMKIHRLGLDTYIVDKLFDLIQTEEFYEPINELTSEFGRRYDYEWQAGFNGRSDGYLVLYQGEQKPSGYKSHCTACGQRNYKSITESGRICGRCHELSRVEDTQTHMSIHRFPGRSIDQQENFYSWDLDSLRYRVEIVCDFDKLADTIVSEAVYMAENYTVEEKVFYTPQTRKVLVGT